MAFRANNLHKSTATGINNFYNLSFFISSSSALLPDSPFTIGHTRLSSGSVYVIFLLSFIIIIVIYNYLGFIVAILNSYKSVNMCMNKNCYQISRRLSLFAIPTPRDKIIFYFSSYTYILYIFCDLSWWGLGFYALTVTPTRLSNAKKLLNFYFVTFN